MRLLFDTHVILWWLAHDERRAEQHRELIADATHQVFVSRISLAEISIKASLGTLDAPTGVGDAVIQSGFEMLAFAPEHAEYVREIPWHHDPFARMRVAHAQVDDLVLVTADRRLHEYDVTVV